MARLWVCGFELQTTTVTMEWATSSNGSPAIETTTVHSGAAAFRVNNTTAENFHHTFTTAQGQYWVRFYFRLVAGATSDNTIIMSILNGGTRRIGFRIRNTANGHKVRLYNEEAVTQIGADSASLSTGQWYRLELGWDSTTLSSTTVEGRLYSAADEGTLIWSESGTANLTANPDRLVIGITGADATLDILYDDVVINNNSGSFCNTWPGPGGLVVLRPDGAGDNDQWARGGADSGSDWGQVDEITPNDATDYIESNTNNQIDDFTLSATPSEIGSGDTINWIGASSRYAVSNTTGSDPDFVIRIKAAPGGTVDETGNISGGGSTTWQSHATTAPKNYPVFGNDSNYQQPGGSTAWTKAALDTAQLGVRETFTDTHFIRVSALWLYVDYTVASGTDYTQDVSGGITPSGAIFKDSRKSPAGTLTSSGAVNKSTAKTFAGGITPAGAVLKQLQRLLAGTLSLAGTLEAGRIILRSFDGTLTSAGTLTKSTLKSFLGGITPSGATLKSTLKSFAGTLTSSGAISTVRGYIREFTGAITPAGTLSKTSSKLFSGEITPTGSTTKQSNKTFSGGITPSGVLTRVGNFFKSLAGAITPAGALLKSTAKTFSGGLTPSGTLARAATFVKSLAGTVTSSGALLKQAGKNLVGSVTPTGDISKSVNKMLSGVLTWAGDVATQLSGGAQTFFKDVSGSLAPTGQILKSTAKTFLGSLTPSGIIQKMTMKSFTGSITPTGAFLRTALKSLSGSITPTGTLTKLSTKFFTGVMTSAGSLNKSINRMLEGNLSAINGALSKQTGKSFSGNVTPTGSISTIRLFVMMLEGTLTLAGAVSRNTFKTLTGSISPSGTLNKFFQKILSGTLSFVGTLTPLFGVIDTVTKVYLFGSKVITVAMDGARNRIASLRGEKKSNVDIEGSREDIN